MNSAAIGHCHKIIETHTNGIPVSSRALIAGLSTLEHLNLACELHYLCSVDTLEPPILSLFWVEKPATHQEFKGLLCIISEAGVSHNRGHLTIAPWPDIHHWPEVRSLWCTESKCTKAVDSRLFTGSPSCKVHEGGTC